MNSLRELWRRLRFRLLGGRFESDLAEEMRLHMDLRAQEKQSQGMDPTLAESAARRQFGNATLLRESSREAWGWTWLDTWFQDLRYILRTFLDTPGFTAVVVLSLALGIGANTAIFSMLNAVILRSLPVEDPGRLVKIAIGEGVDELTNPIWEQVRDHQQAFSGALAYARSRYDLSAGGEKHLCRGIMVSGDFFRVLGVPAARGRLFTADDDRRGAKPLAVISDGFWRRNFDGDPGIVGKSVRLDRHWFTIVGVTPPWFSGLDVDEPYDVAFPLACEPILNAGHSALDSRLTWFLRMVGRLPPGGSLKQAQDQLRAIAPEILRATVPSELQPAQQKDYQSTSFLLQPFGAGFSDVRIQYRDALFTLMTIAGLVLLIACANVANLLLARATARKRELTVRMALGAGRWRLIRQLMTESILLSAFGAGAGFLLALWGSRLLVRMLSTSSRPLDINVAPDFRVLAFSIAITLVTALLFGFAPALRATRLELNQVLKESVRQTVQGFSRFNPGKYLVILQVALSLILLAAAGLFLGTLHKMLTADAGFSRRNVLLVHADLRQTNVPAARRESTFTEILARFQSVPGVESAAFSLIAPMSREGWAQIIEPAGYRPKSRGDNLVFLNRVSPGYFETIRTPLLLGRDFSARDDANAAPVIVLAESTARHFFGSANPIGKIIANREDGLGQRTLYQVIGVVKDARYNRINESPRRVAYLVAAQDAEPEPEIHFEVRSSAPAESLIAPARSAIAGFDKDVSLTFQTFENHVEETMVQPRMVAWLSGAFAGLALLLAMVGLYGITAYSVTRRSGEIGIRVALGAQRPSVIWLMMRDVILLLAVGVVLGLAGALAAGRLVTSLLYGVRPNDPWRLAAAVLTLALATALAAFVPARRAARLDPMRALHDE